MTKPTEQQNCDSQRIEDYLEDRLSVGAADEFEQHLSRCDECRNQLQQRSAEPEIWHDAMALLGSGEDDSLPSVIEEEGASRRKRHALSVLDSLTPTDNPDMLGRVGEYEISGVVGVGGMGAVLKGFDKSLRRVVAIKVMAPHLADSGPARTRFQREARAAAAITHDNVIDTYGVSEANGLPYLVMPFARGPSLQKRIDESGPLTVVEVVRIGRQIASGLAAAHEQGLVHRDIKPANILLNEGIERLWITDFGVARAVDDASMTLTGVIAGTPQYMSPEQARGESVDPRSDLFSMGSVLYTACTGRPPFRSEAAYGILRRITDTDPRPIREINPEIPDWLCRIIDRLMAKHPADRFQSAGEVAELLESCLAHLQQPTQVELPPCVTAPLAANSKSMPAKEQKPPKAATQRQLSRWQRTAAWVAGGCVLPLALAFVAFQWTNPTDITGHWTGESWQHVSLSTVDEATGWYTGSFTDAKGRRGAIHLEWSRLQRRYNGRWKMGEEQSGSVTLRAKGQELRGAISIDSESSVADTTPRLRDFAWIRGDAGVPEIAQGTLGITNGPIPLSIESLVKGRIARWGDGIQENALVEKGELIAEIAEVDPEYRDRLAAQLSASKFQVEAAQALVEANENNLESAKSTLSAYESQLASYELVKSQIAASAAATVESAKNKVDVAKAALAEQEATYTQRQADLDRQKLLFEEAVVSQEKFQEAERKFKEALARLQGAKASVESAENDVVARQNEEKAKEQKSQVDIDFATAQLSKARGDVAKAESELAKSRLELQKSEKEALEMETRLARQASQTIVAPTDGVITKLSSNTIVKAGDLICVISPMAEDSNATVQGETISATANAAPGRVAISGLSGTAVWRITETLSAVSALGQRFRDLRSRLDEVTEGEESSSATSQLEKEFAQAEFERETALEILKGQLDAAKKLNTFQASLRDSVKVQVEHGDLDTFSLGPAEQAVVTTAAEIRQLELLIGYYTSLGEEQTNTAEDDRAIALSVLKVRLDAAQKSHSFQANQSEMIRRRFELGHGDVNDVLKAEQAEATAEAEVQKFEALLRYYEKVGKVSTQPAGALPTTDPTLRN